MSKSEFELYQIFVVELDRSQRFLARQIPFAHDVVATGRDDAFLVLAESDHFHLRNNQFKTMSTFF